MIRALLGLPLAVTCWAQSTPPHYSQQTESDFVVRNFAFKSGETLPELHLHYITIGKPARDVSGHVNNAVLIMHGTGGNGNGFLSERFGDELFRAGQPLDAAKYSSSSRMPLDTASRASLATVSTPGSRITAMPDSGSAARWR